MSKPLVIPEGLVNALRHQRQIDMDGDEVGVSRQAVDEAADILSRPLYTSTPKELPPEANELSAIVRDAVRYQWLKTHATWIACADDDSDSGNFSAGEHDDEIFGVLDAAIDEAITEAQP